jgi:hypothetical protein
MSTLPHELMNTYIVLIQLQPGELLLPLRLSSSNTRGSDLRALFLASEIQFRRCKG